jgi:DNA polymerase-1
MLEHYILDAAARHSKEALAREYLGYDPIPIESLIGEKERGKEQLSMGDLPPEKICDYAAQDADLALQWDSVLRPKVAEAGAIKALEESEEPLVPILMEMEREGVAVDLGSQAELLVRFSDGRIEAVNAGEVTLRPASIT